MPPPDFTDISDLKNLLRSKCEHEIPLESCLEARCREIRKLILEVNRNPDGFDLHDERVFNKKVFSNFIAKKHGGGGLGYRAGLPYDYKTAQAMRQWGVLSERQAKIVGYLDPTEESWEKGEQPKSEIWQQIASRLGCSSRTVRRDFQKVKDLLSQVKESDAHDYPPGSILIKKEKGSRRKSYWITRQVQFLNWKRTLFELLTDRKTINKLLRDPNRKSYQIVRRPIRSSPMNRMVGELIRVFAQRVSNPESLPPKGVSIEDWHHNIKRAKALLKHRTGPLTGYGVFKILAPKYKLCMTCGTPMPLGFRYQGRAITKARDFCNEACGKKFERKRKGALRLLAEGKSDNEVVRQTGLYPAYLRKIKGEDSRSDSLDEMATPLARPKKRKRNLPGDVKELKDISPEKIIMARK